MPPVITPRGDGSFIVAPGKPVVGVEECTSKRAAKILGLPLSTLHDLRNDPVASKILRWRFRTPPSETKTGEGATTTRGGRLAWEVPSLLAYLAASREWGK